MPCWSYLSCSTCKFRGKFKCKFRGCLGVSVAMVTRRVGEFRDLGTQLGQALRAQEALMLID